MKYDRKRSGAKKKSPAPAPSAAVDPRKAALRGQGLEAQRAALSPQSAGGFDAQKAALSPASQGPVADGAARAKLAEVAESAAVEVAEEEVEHPAWKQMGDKVGLALGIAVTRVLKYVPGWNDPIVDEEGEDVHSIPGAERVGEHKLRKRHKEVVGPQISAWVETLSPGRIRDFLAGVGEGATRAPGETYRREVAGR